ncbi:tautomerase family protein [Desulfosporosinus sp. PR]|uniref:tautomerase family protein n=1 Tax=Candidatus Desulfosporosinus nitrosoreducens TaxID=3401928 RepID=UPI0027F9EFEE|nr:tautomerase family protein [Desulfosporosinus sp. PR]MDQ7094803.1 tautomerase family protein [Desulfosporosinus sp. PR]
MPFVKIHLADSIPPDIINSFACDVRTSLVEALQIEETVGQVMVYQTPKEFRSAHISRNVNFVFIEIFMYCGRTAEMKKSLMEKINRLAHNSLGVNPKDINCCIIELPPENCCGGVMHKYIEGLAK